jgi:hypothetical protein
MIHVAGETEGLVQRCAACGVVMLDRTNEQATEPWITCFWPEGAFVLTEPGGAFPLVASELREYGPSEFCRPPVEARVN